MFMLKFFSRQVDIVADHRGAGKTASHFSWNYSQLAADPLSHPDLAAMSMNELADLPLMPENLGRQVGQSEGCRHHH
ncbi:hypothetical protein [Rhizobium sp. RAF56]|jgi:hypothetical protein|uniref:hypothetical protein n=1 Tax=Rhizobium sp. RAF56 TaxID=3233062 RepID=UPI003F9E22C6